MLSKIIKILKIYCFHSPFAPSYMQWARACKYLNILLLYLTSVCVCVCAGMDIRVRIHKSSSFAHKYAFCECVWRARFVAWNVRAILMRAFLAQSRTR